jgi:CheY-like chemotaxis protein
MFLHVSYPGSAPNDCTENISDTGLFIRSGRRLELGERIPLMLSFPGLLDPMAMEVEVVRQRPPDTIRAGGFGVTVPAAHDEARLKLWRLTRAARQEAGSPAGDPYRILVVEDSAATARFHAAALERLATEQQQPIETAVEFATQGAQALERLLKGPDIDLVLTDINMPVMDGGALMRAIRSQPKIAKTPVLVISSTSPDDLGEAANLANVWLPKPVAVADVVRTVQTLRRVQASARVATAEGGMTEFRRAALSRLAERVQALRLELGQGPGQLAEQLGIPEERLLQMERAAWDPPYLLLLRIARVFGVPVTTLC